MFWLEVNADNWYRPSVPHQMPSACRRLWAFTRSSHEDQPQPTKAPDFWDDTAHDTLERTHRRLVSASTDALWRRTTMANNESTALLHLMVALGIFGYAQQYYFHLRMSLESFWRLRILTWYRTPQEQCALDVGTAWMRWWPELQCCKILSETTRQNSLAHTDPVWPTLWIPFACCMCDLHLQVWNVCQNTTNQDFDLRSMIFEITQSYIVPMPSSSRHFLISLKLDE